MRGCGVIVGFRFRHFLQQCLATFLLVRERSSTALKAVIFCNNFNNQTRATKKTNKKNRQRASADHLRRCKWSDENHWRTKDTFFYRNCQNFCLLQLCYSVNYFLQCVYSISVHERIRIMIMMKIIKGASDVCNGRLTSCCSLHAFTLAMASVQHWRRCLIATEWTAANEKQLGHQFR